MKAEPGVLTIEMIEDACQAAAANFGAPGVYIMSNIEEANRLWKILDPTRGMTDEEVKLWKTLYED